MVKVVLSKEKGLINKRLKNIPFLVTYHQILKQLALKIQKHIYLLHINVEFKKTSSS